MTPRSKPRDFVFVPVARVDSRHFAPSELGVAQCVAASIAAYTRSLERDSAECRLCVCACACRGQPVFALVLS